MGGEIKLKINSGLVSQASDIQIARALEKIGLKAEGYAANLTPVGTPESTGIPGYIGGTLKNSMTHKVVGKAVYIGTNVEYAPYIEYGTSRGIKPKHMIKKAVTEHTEEYKDIVKKYLKG